MKPELMLDARPEQRFTLDSFAEIGRAREVLKAQILEWENALTVLDYIERDMQPAVGVC